MPANGVLLLQREHWAIPGKHFVGQIPLANSDQISLFHWATNFFTFLLWSVFLPCVLKRVCHKQPQSVGSSTPTEWSAILSLFLSLLRCSGGSIARNQQRFLRNVNDTNQSLVCRPHTEPWKFWESNKRDATAKDQRKHLGGTAVRTAAWSTASL